MKESKDTSFSCGLSVLGFGPRLGDWYRLVLEGAVHAIVHKLL